MAQSRQPLCWVCAMTNHGSPACQEPLASRCVLLAKRSKQGGTYLPEACGEQVCTCLPWPLCGQLHHEKISLAIKWHHVTFVAALKLLHTYYGVLLRSTPFVPYRPYTYLCTSQLSTPTCAIHPQLWWALSTPHWHNLVNTARATTHDSSVSTAHQVTQASEHSLPMYCQLSKRRPACWAGTTSPANSGHWEEELLSMNGTVPVTGRRSSSQWKAQYRSLGGGAPLDDRQSTGYQEELLLSMNGRVLVTKRRSSTQQPVQYWSPITPLDHQHSTRHWEEDLLSMTGTVPVTERRSSSWWPAQYRSLGGEAPLDDRYRTATKRSYSFQWPVQYRSTGGEDPLNDRYRLVIERSFSYQWLVLCRSSRRVTTLGDWYCPSHREELLLPVTGVRTPFGMDWQFCEGEITEDNIPSMYETIITVTGGLKDLPL
jgi:hypothetical protein